STLVRQCFCHRRRGRAALCRTGNRRSTMPVSAMMRNPTPGPAGAAIGIAVVGAAAILGAYYFQYVRGLEPCPLCLEQRIAYYVAIPLALIVAFADRRGAPRTLLAAALLIMALAMLFNAGLG